METLKQLTFNLNLREPRAQKPTPLYLVVKVDGKQIKMPTGVKVLPCWWSKKKQQLNVSPQLNEVEREKLLQYNAVIFDLKAQCQEVFNYLCSEKHDNIEAFIKSSIKIDYMANFNAKPPKRTVTASKLLKEAFEIFYQTQKQSTIYNNKRLLEHFITFCKQKGDSINRLTQKGINEYQEYLLQEVAKGERTLSSKTINQRCMIVVRLVNDVLTVKTKFEKHNLKQVRYINIQDKRTHDESKSRALTNDEIKAIEDVQGLSPREQEVRDLFVVEINSGVRVSDLMKLFTHDYTEENINGKTIYTIKTQKKGITASVFINETINTILKKYEGGFKEIKTKPFSENRYNEGIKRVAKKAVLTSIVDYCDDVAGKKVAKQAQLCDIISSHWARHTFITNKVLEGYTPKEIIQMTGHADTKMVERIYTHITASDKAQNVAKAVERIEGKQPTTTTTDNDTNKALIAQQAIENFELKVENEISEFFNKANAKIYRSEPDIEEQYYNGEIDRETFENYTYEWFRQYSNSEFNAAFLQGFPTESERAKIMGGARVIDVVNERLQPLGVKYNEDYRLVKI